MIEEFSSICDPNIIEKGKGRPKEYRRFLSLSDELKQLVRKEKMKSEVMKKNLFK